MVYEKLEKKLDEDYSLMKKGYDTLKSMLSDCIKMQHFRSSMDIFKYMIENND